MNMVSLIWIFMYSTGILLTTKLGKVSNGLMVCHDRRQELGFNFVSNQS